jgi:3-methyladenine DNA glycosylase AlkD
MTTDELIRDIKKDLRASMNGILSAQMRNVGMPYKLVFGVELPRLQTIAAGYQPNRQLAQALWNQPIRECKILAAMLMPRNEMLPEMAELWVDEIPAPEIAQMLCMYCFSKEKWAAEKALEWVAQDETKRQLCGFLLIARLLQQGVEFNARTEDEIRDQAEALLPQADLHLQKAIRAAIERLQE